VRIVLAAWTSETNLVTSYVPQKKFHGIHLHFSLKGLFCVVCRLHLREELRLENRQAFANIWSDLVAGFTVLLLLVLNSKQVQLM
jgi:hypothetical protein